MQIISCIKALFIRSRTPAESSCTHGDDPKLVRTEMEKDRNSVIPVKRAKVNVYDTESIYSESSWDDCVIPSSARHTTKQTRGKEEKKLRKLKPRRVAPSI